MSALREKLDGLAEEREALKERIAAVKDGESGIAELEALPDLVEQYLRDLPDLVSQMPVLREYGLAGHEAEQALEDGPALLTPESVQHKSELGLETEHREAEAARGARFRELYTRLGLRASAYADGTLKITVANAQTGTEGVMSGEESG